MFDISGLELALIAAVVIMIFGPKELPGLLRQMGQLMGKARAMSRHLRSGIDEMIRQSELEEMEKQWREENARIMAEHPAVPADAADKADLGDTGDTGDTGDAAAAGYAPAPGDPLGPLDPFTGRAAQAPAAAPPAAAGAPAPAPDSRAA